MSTMYAPSRPFTLERACWFCHHFGGMLFEGSAAGCRHPRCCRVRSDPATGCVCFEREPGCDDDPDHVPAGVSIGPAAFTGKRPGPVASTVVEWAP